MSITASEVGAMVLSAVDQIATSRPAECDSVCGEIE
jgi:hypothetical protein